MSSMPWFRMYVDFLNDPKMISLAFEDQRHFIGVLALKSDGALDNGAPQDLLNRIVAQRLWIDHGVILEVKKRLVCAGLIDSNWQPIAWDSRQFKSDSSKDRVARFRAKTPCNGDVTLHETLHERKCNAVDTDTDTDTDTEEKPMSPLQAKDDPAPVSRLNGKKIMVEQVMDYLNLQARRNYRTANPNGTPTAGALVISQRLKDGYTVDQCKDVIGEKSNQWMGHEKMDQYLNPQTLFRKSNFDKYLAEAEAVQ